VGHNLHLVLWDFSLVRLVVLKAILILLLFNDLQPIILENLPSLLDLIDQGSSSYLSSNASSLSVASSNSLTTALDNFEIFEFRNFDLSAGPETSTTLCHNLEQSHLTSMTSDYGNNKALAVKDDGGQATEEQLLQMLTLISNQMISSYQDLQNQIAQSEAKFSMELQNIVQDNTTFK
jgi:hypothetical protein